MLLTRLATHHSDADLVSICDTEPMSECIRSDGQLPLPEQHLLGLSSPLTRVPCAARQRQAEPPDNGLTNTADCPA